MLFFSSLCELICIGCTKASIGLAESSSRLSKKSSSHLFSSLVRHCLASYPNVAADMIYARKELDIKKVSTTSDSAAKSGACTQHNMSRNCAVEDFLGKPYAWWKKVNPAYNSRRDSFLSKGPFALWLCDDPLLNDQFSIEIAVNDAPVKKVFTGQKSCANLSDHDSCIEAIANLARDRNHEDCDETCLNGIKKSRHN